MDLHHLFRFFCSREEAALALYIVFFCTEDVGKAVKELLKQQSFQDILKVEGPDSVSFLYETIHKGIKLAFYESQYSAEAPSDSAGPWGTSCGMPLRLYPNDPNVWRRATLGGVLEATSPTHDIGYYAMTAGHFLDNWDDSSDEQEYERNLGGRGSQDPSQSLKSSPRDVPGTNEDTHSTSYLAQDTSPWNFGRPKRYAGLITGNPTRETLKYFDWTVFRLDRDEWNPNSFVRTGARYPSFICDHRRNSVASARKRVAILTASSGMLHGVVLAGMAQLAIEPGEEVIDVLIISLQSHGGGGYW
ncbi:hypothetical protein QBC34DRAFT_378788 [Podospora aff. communis PSN243]|uniref:Uncharacterized protein n=1 Tax=Podospora aff. communis PSN243 TaxID=3040156 RepID=A0AAV9GRQ0_9PEZI|nr:hypothetical protein QBC34DRAFT_378788 [Podospora aff. communis PSN243]